MADHSTCRQSWLRVFAAAALALLASRATCAGPPAPARPNIVLVIADDLGWWSAGCYGDPNAKTPHLDKLAAQGMKFERAFACAPVCTPCRAALGTGLYPVRSRVLSNQTLPKNVPGLRSVVEHLEALGYRVGLFGKTDIGPYGGDRARYSVQPEKFLKQTSDRPLLLVYGSNRPHLPWEKAADVAPEKLAVPPMLVDTPETRRALCDYYAELSRFDDEVGRCVAWVEEAGLAPNTVLIVTGEQGAPFPGGKWTCYDDGLRTVLIVRWPGKVRSGSRTDALVQYIDVAPTLVEIGGGKPETCDTGLPGAIGGGRGFDGRSFLGVLLGDKTEHDRLVFGAFGDQIRSVRDDRYLYVVNRMPGRRHDSLASALQMGIWPGWVREAKTNAAAARLVKRVQSPPAEEFYDAAADPHQLHNLVAEAKYRQPLEALRRQLHSWRQQYGDAPDLMNPTPIPR